MTFGGAAGDPAQKALLEAVSRMFECAKAGPCSHDTDCFQAAYRAWKAWRGGR